MTDKKQKTNNQKNEILVIIPAFNEEKNIRSVVEGVIKEGYSVLVVNDGSEDATEEQARKGGAIVANQKENKGKGSAVKKGFDYALQNNYLLVVLMDGDGQHDPAEIRNLISALKEDNADMVIGTRMASTKNMPFIRKATNVVTSKIVSFFAKGRLTDTQSGFRVLRSEVIKNITLDTNRFDTESEIIIKAGKKGYVIRETPVSTIYGKEEKSSIHPVGDTYRFIKLIIRCLFS